MLARTAHGVNPSSYNDTTTNTGDAGSPLSTESVDKDSHVSLLHPTARAGLGCLRQPGASHGAEAVTFKGYGRYQILSGELPPDTQGKLVPKTVQHKWDKSGRSHVEGAGACLGLVQGNNPYSYDLDGSASHLVRLVNHTLREALTN